MALKPTALSQTVVSDPPPDEGPEFHDMQVDQEIGPGSTNIIIDARTGHVMVQNPDGSIDVKPVGDLRPKRVRKTKSFGDNLAEDMDESVLSRIATRVLEGIENDVRSRSEWVQTAEKGMTLLGTKIETATVAIGEDGLISKVKHVGLLRACISLWSSSRAELLPVGGPVKVRDDKSTEDVDANPLMGHNGGPALDDPPSNVIPMPLASGGPGIAQPMAGAAPIPPPKPTTVEQRNKLSQDFQNDFNHYLTVIDRDYYPDFSRMLMSRGLLGTQFRKVYVDPILRMPVSRWVRGVDLIISNEATSLQSAARITERIPTRQSVVARLQIGDNPLWRDVPLVIPTTKVSSTEQKIAEIEGVRRENIISEDQLHTIYETQTDLDESTLRKDETGRTPGYPLPYLITIDEDSRVVLAIRRNWKKGDPNHRKRRRFVKYGCVPGLGFYDWGFVHMIGNAQRAATMIEQNLIDTGMLASFPGGVMGKSPGTRVRTNQIRPTMGEFAVVDTGGLPISDFVMPWPYKEPSATLAAMGDKLENQMNQIAGVVELPVGEGMTNVPVGTIMAYIENVTKVPSAIHKDDHIAQQEEFELLKELFADDPKMLTKFAKKPARVWSARQEVEDQDLVPAADPNISSQTHRLMQTNMMVQVGGLPQFGGIANQRAIWESFVRVTGNSNTGEYTLPPPGPNAPPPPPPPAVAAAMIRKDTQMQTDQMKAAQAEKDRAAELEKERIRAEDHANQAASQEQRAGIAADAKRAQAHADVLKHGITTFSQHQQHSEKLDHEKDKLDQKHLTDTAGIVQRHTQHLNEHALAQDELAQAALEPDTTGGTDG